MYIILSTPVAAIIIIYAIYKWLKRKSDQEKEFWWDQKHLRGGRGCKIYAAAKAILLLIAIVGIMLIVVSLAYGQVPRLHDLSNEKFLTTLLGASFLVLTQLGFFGLIYLLKRASRLNLGKIILFFAIIGAIAVILIAGICLAAF